MLNVKHGVLLLLFCLSGCKHTDSDIASAENAPLAHTDIVKSDREQIEQLVKDMYGWHERKMANFDGWYTLKKGNVVTGYDMKHYSLYLKALDESGYFAGEFCNNLTKITKKQAEMLKNGTVEWLDGDMSPFDNGSSRWCNCQDMPDSGSHPYSNIIVTIEALTQDKASIRWSWADEQYKGMPDYQIRTVKKDGKWKIAWMEGWDYGTSITLK